jgi:hypothetical protein
LTRYSSFTASLCQTSRFRFDPHSVIFRILFSPFVCRRAPQDAIRAFLATDDLKAEVISEIQTWQQKVTGVPHFVIDGKHEFSGAQDTSFLLSVFKRIGVPLKNNL